MIGMKAGLKFCVDAYVSEGTCEPEYSYNQPFILHIPEPTNEKKTGFEVIELMVAFLIKEGIRIKIREKKLDQEIYCVCCKNVAKAGVAWYPFDVSTWDGINLPIVIHGKDEHSTCPIRVMAWCGVNIKCKTALYAKLMKDLVKTVSIHNFTGGLPYCMICGTSSNLLVDQETCVVHCLKCAPRRFQPSPAKVLKYMNLK
jgi:hypothetical protein